MFKEDLAKVLSKKFNLTTNEVLKLIEIPPNQALGDFAFPCFSLAKELKKSPMQIASDNQDIKANFLEEVNATGPYLNFFVKKDALANKLKTLSFDFKHQNQTVLVESPSPNTNKPLHLGHLRNMLLGLSVKNIYEKLGNKVILTEVVNDKGTHICKSMLAYELYGKNETPKTSNMKGDFFVGKYYVEFSKRVKENPELEEKAQEMLVAWENNDKKTVELWNKMRSWCLDGFKESYQNFGMNIDKAYYESEIYLEGKKIVQDGLKKGLFQKEEDGAIYVDLESKGLGKKYLQRKDGTSIYITQDMYLAKKRYDDFKMDKLLYVVGSEQDYHFKTLFEIFKILDYKFKDACHHLSYGMIFLPEGKMKSREGTVVDADTFRLEVINDAKKELKQRYGLSEIELNKRAEIIGMGALKFFILKYDSKKDMVYNPKESLSFSGETGPYIQYNYARIQSIFRKTNTKPNLNSKNLTHDLERELIKKLFEYKEVTIKASIEYRPNLIANYLLDLAQTSTKYYHDVQIINEDKEIEASRLYLLEKVALTIKDGLSLLGINVLDEM
jgi:arginyl-tRNA synthetase